MRGQHRLVFASAGANVGTGPLEIVAERASTAAAEMRAVQIVQLAGGGTRQYENVGDVRYVVSSDHEHWHFLHFMRYELRRTAGGRALVRDRKTGFCLGDRYDTGLRLAGKPRSAFFRGGCGFRERDLLTVREGISVGYGDNYRAELEGQYLVLNGLRGGRYRLVHVVDQQGRLHESNRRNNVSWVELRLTWRGRRPAIRLRARCGGSARCAL